LITNDVITAEVISKDAVAKKVIAKDVTDDSATPLGIAVGSGAVVMIVSGLIAAAIPVAYPGWRFAVMAVAVGAFAHACLEAAAQLTAEGYGVTVVDPRWVRPVPLELVALAREHSMVVTVEDGVRTGGVGDALAKAMRDGGVRTPLRDLGVALDWHPHGTRGEILADLGLTAVDIARDVRAALSDIDIPASL